MDRHELEEKMIEVFRQLSRKTAQEKAKQLEQGISHSQAVILDKLKSDGPVRFSDLAERMYMTPGAITGLSDKLIALGYARRKRSEEDRRVVFLEITQEGEKILESVRKQIQELFNFMFKGLSDEDLENLIRIYKKILDSEESQTS